MRAVRVLPWLLCGARALAGELDAPCQTLWLDLGGKGQDACLAIDKDWPLADFERQSPGWDPAEYDANGRFLRPASRASLSWTPLEGPAQITSVGSVGGIRLYRASYGPSYQVFLAEVRSRRLRPVLIVSGSDDIVAGIYEPESFEAAGQRGFHVRIQIQGTGNLQESLFLVPHAGRVEVTRPDFGVLNAWLETRGWRLYHRGGGFCKGRLEFQAPIEQTAGTHRGGITAGLVLRAGRIVFESYKLTLDEPESSPPEPASQPCEIYPSNDRRPTSGRH